MKIGITCYPTYGGSGVVATELGMELAARGHEGATLHQRAVDIAHGHDPGQVIYLLSGMLGWSLFVELVSRSLNIFVDNAGLLKKIVFPKICLPLIVSGSALVNNFLLLVATLGVFVIIGHNPGIHVLWLFVLIPLTLAFSTGLGLILGTLNVFIRDVAQVMSPFVGRELPVGAGTLFHDLARVVAVVARAELVDHVVDELEQFVEELAERHLLALQLDPLCDLSAAYCRGC